MSPDISTASIVAAAPRARARHTLLGSSALLLLAGLDVSAARASDHSPVGGTVASGSASIATAGTTTTISQGTNKAIINWQGFSVGPDNSVVFNQPDARSATLNRVTGTTGSEIGGQIRSNGAVYLINPNGIAITRTGSIQTGGGFVASTLGMTDADFNAGKLTFTGKGGSAAVRNDGNIAAGRGAYVALLGGSVSNAGAINVPLGKVGLGSGEQVGLDLNGDHFMQVGVPTKAITGDGALIDMAGRITAAGGRVTLSAASVKDAVRNVINLSGIISADSATGHAGAIELLGGLGGTVTATGTLTARATGATGNGGTVETSGASVNFTGLKVDTSTAHGTTGSWLVDPTDLTVDAVAAATISANLATTNVTLQTFTDQPPSGPGVSSPGNGDININSALAWASTNGLTLLSANNINLNAAITAPLGALSLTAGFRADQPHAISDTAPVKIGSFVIAVGNWVQNTPILPAFSATNFSFSPYSASFTRATRGDGSAANPFLLTDIYGIQGMRRYDLTGQSFALANDVDASGTAGWNAGAGFIPIGDNGPFTGNFDGQGHAISGLTINTSTNNVGLFAQDKGDIGNLNLVGGTITATGATIGALVGYQGGGTISNVSSSVVVNGGGNVGGLVGISDGTIVGSSATGAVNATGSEVGGLVGYLGYARRGLATISNSFATGNVTDTSGRASDVGGLVGYATGTIDHSYATGNVAGAAGVDSVGGLVGSLFGLNNNTNPVAAITNSYATGDVSSGNGYIGGLVGAVYTANISGSYAKGKATDTGAGQYFGGLVGGTRGTNSFTNVYATGDVSGTYDAGGLVGYASGTTIAQAHASGNVTSSAQNGGNGSGFGGLVGSLSSDSSITQSYASGNVTHSFVTNAYGSSVGGLVGVANGSITYSHASGVVSGTNDNVGGLIGLEANQSGVADTNNYATGAVIGNTLPDAYFTGASIGGLIGAVGATETITASYATGNVSAVGHSGNQIAGGLIGFVGNVQLTLTKSYATGNVSVTGAVSTVDGYGYQTNNVSNRVGGLIGQLQAYAPLVDQVYATGNVSSDGRFSEIGGLIGLFYDGSGGTGIVKNSYATGSVTGTGHYGPSATNDQAGDAGGGNYKQNIGGLIGRIGLGSVANSYAVGAVSGADDVGGLVGYASSSGATVTSSYTTGFDNGQGGKSLTPAQMQDITKYRATYAGWDFDTIWAPPSTGNYPQLYALTPVIYATAGSAATSYGTAPISLGTFKGGPTSYVFGPAGDTLTGFLAGSTTATTASNAGQYAVTPYGGGTFTSTNGVVYRVVADGTGTLTINPAVITVTNIAASLIGSTTKVYDGTTGALLTAGNFLLSGFKNGDGASVNQTVGSYASTNVGTGILVTAALSSGNFTTNTGTMLSNYVLPTSAAGMIGAITPATLALVYTAGPVTRSYGDANPAFTGAVMATGLVGADSLATVTKGTALFTSAATTASNAGGYGINGAGLTGTSGNYTLTVAQAAGNAMALTITPRALTLAAAPLTRTYGASNPATDSAQVQASTNFVNGDTIGSVGVTSSATATSNVGGYNLLAGNALFSTGLASNYRITYVDAPTALTISPAMLSVTYVAAPGTSVYGNIVPALTGTTIASGLVNGDSLAAVTTGTAAFSTTASKTSGVGGYAVIGSGIGSGSANYTLTTSQAAGNATALQITPRPVTVSANGGTSVYGATQPTLNYAVAPATAGSGLVNGDTLTGALSSTATAASGVGQYAITRGSLANPNYSFTFNGATLTITPAALQVLYTAFATSSIYGNAIPTLAGSTTAFGLVNGDTLAGVVTGTVGYSTSATAKSNIGGYAVIGGGLSLGSKNYTVTFTQAAGNGTALTITPRNIVVTADPQKRYILLNNPTLTYSVGGLGLVNGDTLTGRLSTTAQVLSSTGSYPITLGTLAATPNYSLTFIGSTLQVSPPPTQSLSDFLAWLRQVVTQFERREKGCDSGSVSSSLRTKGSAGVTGAGCGR